MHAHEPRAEPGPGPGPAALLLRSTSTSLSAADSPESASAGTPSPICTDGIPHVGARLVRATRTQPEPRTVGVGPKCDQDELEPASEDDADAMTRRGDVVDALGFNVSASAQGDGPQKFLQAAAAGLEL